MANARKAGLVEGNREFEVLAQSTNGVNAFSYARQSLSCHTSTRVGNSVYVYGGYQDSKEDANGKVFALNLATKEWQAVKQSRPAPLPRFRHQACLVGDCLIISGGYSYVEPEISNSRLLDEAYELVSWKELWKFDLIFHTWERIRTRGSKPENSSAAIWHEKSGELFLFSEYSSAILAMNLSTFTLYEPKQKGELPHSRSSWVCCDQSTGRFYMLAKSLFTLEEASGSFIWKKVNVACPNRLIRANLTFTSGRLLLFGGNRRVNGPDWQIDAFDTKMNIWYEMSLVHTLKDNDGTTASCRYSSSFITLAEKIIVLGGEHFPLRSLIVIALRSK